MLSPLGVERPDLLVRGEERLWHAAGAQHVRHIDLGPRIAHGRVEERRAPGTIGDEVVAPHVAVRQARPGVWDQLGKTRAHTLDSGAIGSVERCLHWRFVKVAQHTILCEEAVTVRIPGIALCE